MLGQQDTPTASVPGHRPGRVVMFLLTPMKRTPRDRKTRLRMAVRAAQYRRGGMFLAALRWHAARDDADRHEIQAAVLAVLRLLAACGEPADDLSATAADQRARAILTAAPPRFPAPVLAGAAA